MGFQRTHPKVFQTATVAPSILSWWNMIASWPKNDDSKRDIKIAVYIVWNIWKERGRRIFQNKNLTAHSLAGIIRDEVQMLELAFRQAGE